MSGVGVSSAFPKCLRLTTRAEFEEVFAEGKRIQGVFFTILFKANKFGYPRLGVIVAKKKLKLAIERNLLRRIIRESFRLTQQKFMGVDCVVILRKEVKEQERRFLREELLKQWTKLSLFGEK